MALRTEHTEAVVEGDDDDVAIAGQHAAVHHVPRALSVGAAVDVYHHRPLAPLLVDVWGRERDRESYGEGERVRERERERESVF